MNLALYPLRVRSNEVLGISSLDWATNVFHEALKFFGNTFTMLRAANERNHDDRPQQPLDYTGRSLSHS